MRKIGQYSIAKSVCLLALLTVTLILSSCATPRHRNSRNGQQDGMEQTEGGFQGGQNGGMMNNDMQQGGPGRGK